MKEETQITENQEEVPVEETTSEELIGEAREMENVEEETLDSEIEGFATKEVTQESSIDEKLVEEQMGGMSFLWETIHKKFEKDLICFSCKGKINIDGDEIKVVEISKADPGICAFASLCKNCFTKHSKEQESKS